MQLSFGGCLLLVAISQEARESICLEGDCFFRTLSISGVGCTLVPRLDGEGEKRAWYTPFAHVLKNCVYWSGCGKMMYNTISHKPAYDDVIDNSA